MWPFGEKFSKPKFTPKGEIQLSAPLEYEKHVSKAAAEDAERARPREEYERGIEDIVNSKLPFEGKLSMFLNLDKSLIEESLKKYEVTKEDIILVDAELENRIRKSAEGKDLDSWERKSLEKIHNSNLVSFGKWFLDDSINRPWQYLVIFIWGKINGQEVLLESNGKYQEYRGSLGGKKLSSEDARNLFGEYSSIASDRTMEMKKWAEENQKKKVEKELQPLKREAKPMIEDGGESIK